MFRILSKALMLFAGVFAALALLTYIAAAQDPVPDSIVTGEEWWNDVLYPVAITALSIVSTVVVGIVGFYLNKWFGIQINGDMRKTLHSAAMTAGSALVAKGEGLLKDRKIDLRDPRIAEAVDWVRTTGAGDAVRKFELSKEDIAELIISKIGLLQAGKTGDITPPTEAAGIPKG